MEPVNVGYLTINLIFYYNFYQFSSFFFSSRNKLIILILIILWHIINHTMVIS